jgi:hypothetical protein
MKSYLCFTEESLCFSNFATRSLFIYLSLPPLSSSAARRRHCPARCTAPAAPAPLCACARVASVLAPPLPAVAPALPTLPRHPLPPKNFLPPVQRTSPSLLRRPPPCSPAPLPSPTCYSLPRRRPTGLVLSCPASSMSCGSCPSSAAAATSAVDASSCLH